MNKQKQAFTLVELIVVITILAILGTIAFISLQGYSKDARDSIRISDVSSMKTSLELFHLDAGKYPLPDEYGTFTYSGNILFYQGFFGAGVVQSLSRNITEVPLDPLTERRYIYSVSNNKNELEILSLLEGDNITMSTISQTNAAGVTVIPKITGNYNGLFIKTKDHIVPLPSIINAELPNETTLLMTQGILESMVTNLGENIPNYGNIVSNTGVLTGLVLTGALNNLTKDSDSADKAAVIEIIKAAYVGEVSLSSEGIIEYILNVATDDVTLAAVFDTTVLNKTTTVSSSEVVEVGPLITQTTCNDAGWMWVDNLTDVYIGTIQGNGFCISPRIGDFGDATGNGISFNGWGNHSSGDYDGWDSTSIDDSGNLVPQYGQTKILDSNTGYTCKLLGSSSTDFDTIDNIAGRMKWLATNKVNLTELQDIEWVQNAIPPNTHPIPVLYIADCIDGVKDLGTDMDYKHYPDENLNETITYVEYSANESSSTSTANLSNAIYQNRQKYLTAWTQKSGSHLPSAMSYITSGYASASDVDGEFLITSSRGEYQVACEAGLLTDSNDNTDSEWIWTSAVGESDGTNWISSARMIGNNACGDQLHGGTGQRIGFISARFIVRP